MIENQIKELRKKDNLTQEDLALKLNISRQTISKWEQGMSEPDIQSIIKISQLFNVSTDFLLTGENKNEDLTQISHEYKMNFWMFLSERWWLVIILLLIICGTLGQIFS
ncbi:helix-turn-helix domain-containing protein [Streptococcus uberis]|uniref:helix-turn-helix domain-containing protein n=1 Tax=Streptococcus uberis TaxID=1349 RepID=UPI0019399B83|nr:helix-turn-helix transcriptional regulator [Streptococcus uberis]